LGFISRFKELIIPRAAGRALRKTYGGKFTAGRNPKNAGRDARGVMRGRRGVMRGARASERGRRNAGGGLKS